MTSAPFEIKVVYDASQRRRRGAVVRSTGTKAARMGTVLALGALLHLAVAGAMYFVTWWRGDPFIYVTLMTRVPLDVPSEFAANPFGITAPATPSDQLADQPVEDLPSDETPSTPLRWGGKTAQVLIPATAYGWLVLATASACAVALAGGAWLGAAGGTWTRVAGFIGMLALLGGAGYLGYRIWAESQMMFKPDQLRWGMGIVALLFALIGLALAGKVRGITKFSGFVVIVAAVGTAAAIWLGTQSGALDAHFAAWPWLAGAGGIHAVWGLVLLLTANRIRA